jgi:DNA-binding CsgD family transcriptional regulator
MGVENLSERERECLRLVLYPMRAKEIARTLGLSTYTVNDHLRNARVKLGVNDSFTAAHMLRKHESEHPEKIEPTEWGWRDTEIHGQNADSEDSEEVILREPFAVRGRPWNRLSLGWRIVWPLLLFGIVALGAGLLLGAIASLSQLYLSATR